MIELINVFARGGGGGSSGGGGAIGIIALPIILYYSFKAWKSRRKRIDLARKNQAAAQATDASWSNEAIQQRVQDVFYRYQQDWSNFNLEGIRAYTTERYYKHMVLVLTCLHTMGRQNLMQNVNLQNIQLMRVEDSTNDEEDRFDVEIKASALDQLKDRTLNKLLSDKNSAFTELWHFDREGGEFKLDGITQYTLDNFNGTDARAFAQRNNFFYSPDFGWLLMPLRGQLFTAASFGHSDINHHVIGLHGQTIMQFFQYVPFVDGKVPFIEYFKHLYYRKPPTATYTVAHTTLPRDYSNIVVEVRSLGFYNFRPIGLQKVTPEWPDFNKRFNAYAADIDKFASLELLHPTFMEKLYATPFKVGIEIIGNDLYFYSADKNADYQTLFVLLQEAFAEMKM